MLTKQVPRAGLISPGRYSAFFRTSVDLPLSQSSCPVEASRLQLTHSSERTAGAQANSTPTAIRETERREENIWHQKFFLAGNQRMQERCDECDGSKRQNEPLVVKGTDIVASADAPINQAFDEKQTSTKARSLRHPQMQTVRPSFFCWEQRSQSRIVLA